MKLVTLLFGVLGIVLIPWTIYANTSTQKAECIVYQIFGQPAPGLQRVTCLLNGHS